MKTVLEVLIFIGLDLSIVGILLFLIGKAIEKEKPKITIVVNDRRTFRIDSPIESRVD